MTKTKRCPLCYGYKTINVWEEVARDETSVTCKKIEKTCSICNGTGEVPVTNADRIRAMSDEELAKEILFFCPTDTVFKGEDTYGKPHYTGLGGRYYATSEEVVASNLEWLQQPAE